LLCCVDSNLFKRNHKPNIILFFQHFQWCMRRAFSVHHQKNVFNKDRLWELKVKKNRNIVSENINTRIKYNILSYFFNKKLNSWCHTYYTNMPKVEIYKVINSNYKLTRHRSKLEFPMKQKTSHNKHGSNTKRKVAFKQNRGQLTSDYI